MTLTKAEIHNIKSMIKKYQEEIKDEMIEIKNKQEGIRKLRAMLKKG